MKLQLLFAYSWVSGSVEDKMLVMWETTKLLTCLSCSMGKASASWTSSLGWGFFISTKYAATRFCMGLALSKSTCMRISLPCDQNRAKQLISVILK